ncbi:MAG TPA: PAS domain S-box protein, partial [Steroidobacteraceae bacterium]|nr:PAS domain S-box protein [Steroidobacteraceae bacterium]
MPLASLPGAVVMTDQAGAITFVNAEAVRLTGWTAKAARGRLVGELLKHFPPRRGQRAVSFQQWLKSRIVWNTLWRCQLTPRRGRTVKVQVRAQPLIGAAGRIGGAVINLERRSPVAAHAGRAPTVSAMFRRGQPFRAAFEDTAIGMALVNPAGKFLRVNQALCAIVGYTSAELLSLTFQSLTHPEDLGGSLRVRDQLLAGAPDQHWEKRYIHKDGHIVWVRLSAAPLRDKRGKVRYFVSGFQDITALKNVAESLRDSETLFRSTFDASAVGIVLINPDGYVLRANQALARFVGYAAEELVGKHVSLINFPEGDVEGVARRQQMIAGGMDVGYPIDKAYRHKSGAELWGRLSAALVRDATNRPSYFIGFIQDVT